MDETRVMFQAIIERLDIQGARIEDLSNKVDHLSGEVAQVKNDMDIMKSDIAEIKDGQSRQDKILESLALRSLEQETDIRELKRAI